MPPVKQLPERFWRKVSDSDEDGCWPWIGAKTPAGYGQLWWEDRPQYAHRLVYELFNEPIPEGFDIDHLCLNPSCVNPGHLEAVTHRTNILRGTSPPANQARQTVCGRGHPFSEENTMIENGKRRCRTCYVRSYTAYNQRKKAIAACL